jgi:hypothetical protein
MILYRVQKSFNKYQGNIKKLWKIMNKSFSN